VEKFHELFEKTIALYHAGQSRKAMFMAQKMVVIAESRYDSNDYRVFLANSLLYFLYIDNEKEYEYQRTKEKLDKIMDNGIVNRNNAMIDLGISMAHVSDKIFENLRKKVKNKIYSRANKNDIEKMDIKHDAKIIFIDKYRAG